LVATASGNELTVTRASCFEHSQIAKANMTGNCGTGTISDREKEIEIKKSVDFRLTKFLRDDFGATTCANVASFFS
jgi:hypothetical protein